MVNNTFFDAQTDQSKVKSIILSKYFDAWAGVMLSTFNKHGHSGQHKIAYIDLFSGPGIYNDGTDSTPLIVLKKAINNPEISQALVTCFIDKDEKNTCDLRKNIKSLPKIDTMKYKPEIITTEIGDKIVKLFERMPLIPTLFFIDPWGYKGVSLRLIDSIIKDFGCDCLFFFNYNRINAGLTNTSVKEHMEALFGKDRFKDLIKKVEKYNTQDREFIIIEELCQAIKSSRYCYTLPFRFKDKNGTRTSHHLIFISKHVRGYTIMKDIMARESSDKNQGVPSFEYNPADYLPKQGLLFELSRPLDELGDKLLRKFAGKELSMKEIYEQDHVDTPYIKKNYKDVLLNLEKNGTITVNRESRQKKDKIGDKAKVKFPV